MGCSLTNWNNAVHVTPLWNISKISYGTAMMTSSMIDCVSRSQQQVETKRKLWKQEYEKTLIREMVRGMHKCVLF